MDCAGEKRSPKGLHDRAKSYRGKNKDKKTKTKARNKTMKFNKTL